MLKIKVILFFSLFCVSHVWCQVEIKGMVISKDDKLPLPGVSVLEKGSQNGTITALDGKFILNVSDSNSILQFYYVGYEMTEVPLNKKTEITIKLKLQCHRDWFDTQRIGFFVTSGLVNNPIGGQLDLSFPAFYSQTTLWSRFRYQTNLDENQLLFGELGIYHLFVSCDFDADLILNFRKISFQNKFNAKTISIESNLNFKSLKFILGYNRMDFYKNETADSHPYTGPLIGMGKWIGRPFNLLIIGKASIFKNDIEYQAELNKRFKYINTFGRFNKIDSFTEFTVGIGYEFTYRFNNQRIK